MAIVDPSGPNGHLRGKVGGIIYSKQPDGRTTARSVGVSSAEDTAGEKRGQSRMKLGNAYMHGILADPSVRAPYDSEAQIRQMRTCDLVMSDFLTDPVIRTVDAVKYTGLAGGWLLIMTGDEFKVQQVGVVMRDAHGRRLEEGLAVLAQGSSARVWIYTAQRDLPAGQTLTLEVTATDRPGHSTVLSAPVAI
jgi:hypothetical protein